MAGRLGSRLQHPRARATRSPRSSGSTSGSRSSGRAAGRRRRRRVADRRSGSSRTPRRPSARATCSTRTRRTGCRSSSRARRGRAPPVAAADSSGACGSSRRSRARLGRTPVRARRGERAPNDPDAQVAAAVGLYDKDKPGARFLAARPARAPFSARADRSLPPRTAPRSGFGASARPSANWPSPLRKTRNPLGKEARLFLKPSGESLGPIRQKMSRSAYGACPEPAGTLRLASRPVPDEGGRE